MTLIKKNNFTVTLLGTGSGSLFISIMVTHAFFHAISDVVAFALLLLWIAGVLVLVKVSDSLLLNIIAHAGMIVSLCFAYAIGMSQDKLPLILAYHALSVAFIIIGNKICYEKTFRMGLFVSLFMSFVAVLTMYFYYAGTSVRMDVLQLGIVTAAFVLQFIGALVISGFLLQSTSQIKDKSNRILVFVFNLALAFGVIYITTYLFPLLIASLGSPEMQLLGFIPSYPVMVAVTAITTLITLAYGFGCIVLQKKLKLDSAFEHIVIIAGCSYITFQLLSLYILTLISYSDAIRIPWLVLIVLVLAACFAATKNRIYALTACIVLAFDMFLMLVGGYASLVAFGTIFSGFAYLGISLAILTYFWTQLDPERKSALLTPFKIAVLLVSELSVTSIFPTGGISVVYALLLITLTFLVFFVTKFEAAGSNQRGFWSFMRVHEIILVVINAFYIADSVAIGLAKIPYLLLSMVSVTLLGLTLYRISQGPETKKWLGVFVGIGLTLIIVASVGGLTSWLDEPYVLSLVWMATALVCILAGFFLRVKPLRLYGLIVIIGCVLKLVILDIGAAATLMRVIALIVGGLICFGISALYSYAAKRFDAAPTNNGPAMPVVGKLSVPVGNVPAAPNGYTSPASGDNAPAISADNGQNTRV